MSNLPAYRKTVAAILGAFLTWGYTASSDGIQSSEWWGAGIAVATALGVFGVSNEPVDDDGGQSSVDLLVKVVAFIILVVFAVWLVDVLATSR